MRIPESIRDLVATGPLGHLTTINEDGSPQVSIVWVGIEGDEFVFGHMKEHLKVRNVRRDPRVVLSMLAPDTTAEGLREHVIVTGSAQLTEGGAAELLEGLAKVYLDLDGPFLPETTRHQPGYVMHVRPERFGGIGPWSSH